jgi:subtilisin family serine protease
MKTFLNLLLIVAIGLGSLTAQVVSGPKLSGRTQSFLQQYAEAGVGDKVIPGYLGRQLSNGQWQLSAIAQISNTGLAESSLQNLGIQVRTRAGNIWTLFIPPAVMPSIHQLQGIEYLTLDEPAYPHLTQARKTTRVDSAHSGIQLPIPYSGKNVVVGIIDFGFEYHHPTFFDTTGAVYRVKQVWEMESLGIPPTGYSYGHELTDPNQIQLNGTDNPEQTHGTGVCGIAAGSGYGSSDMNRRCRGVAYESDLVFVGVRRDSLENQWLTGGFADFIDGISYIFNYAQTVSKPAVVNISWGAHSGPHDGSNLFNQACNQLSGPGRIIVMSAGNDGEAHIHLKKTFQPTDSILSTYLTFQPSTYQRTWIDVWGTPGQFFCAEVQLYAQQIGGQTTLPVCIDNTTTDTFLIAANGTDTCWVTFLKETSAFNGQPRMTVQIFNKSQDTVGLKFTSTQGTLHMWDESYYYGYSRGYSSEFDSLWDVQARSGDTETTVSDMGSATDVLLVGAYTSKVNFTDYAGNGWSYSGYTQTGNLTPFSSRGPMRDGRIKPDISAPGMTITTASSAFDTAYTPGGSRQQLVAETWTDLILNRTFYYSEFSGTSASSPMVAGIVALFLQTHPQLDPQQILTLMDQTAIQDIFTGVLPAAGNNNWGQGKVNAYQALLLLNQSTAINPTEPQDFPLVIYPNPGKDILNLWWGIMPEGEMQLEIFGLEGKSVYQNKWQVTGMEDKAQISADDFAPGIYILRLITPKGAVTKKIQIQE